VTPRVFKPKQVKIGDFDDAGVREGVVVAVPECLAGPGGAVAVFGRATRKLLEDNTEIVNFLLFDNKDHV